MRMNPDKMPARSTAAKMVSLGFALFLLLLAEVITRLAIPSTHLDNILEILRRDRDLFWRQRADLATRFAKVEIRTDGRGFRIGDRAERIPERKAPGRVRVVCMGASPTFGWGVPFKDTYSQRLQELLRRDFGLAADVVNAGMIGYSSHQGVRLLASDILPTQPDLVMVSYVINDIDKYRFFGSDGRPDRDVPIPSAALIGLQNALDHSRFYRLFQKVFLTSLHRRASFDGRPVEIFRPRSVRVPPDEYRDNLARLVRLAKAHGAGIVFLVMPVNLPEPPDVPEGDRASTRDLADRGIALAEAGKYREALEPLSRAVERDPYLSEAHYFLGVCHRRLGESWLAEESFTATMKSESYRCGADGLRYNRIMREAAAELQVPLVDAAAAFRNHPEEYLFNSPMEDPIHPNARGHALIAHEAAGVVAEALRSR